MRVFVLFVACVCLLIHLCCARGDDLVPREQLDALAKPLVDGGWTYGLAVGLVNEQGTQFAGYGRASEANASPPAADTLFEIGSISKAFTGVLLAIEVERGGVKLTDSVQSLLGESMKIPRGKREITLVDLATHSSGLTRMPSNFTPQDVHNPYADYTVEQMAAFLAGHKLRREPGERYEYSNLAMGLLGHALAAKHNTTYEALLREEICKPLELDDTCITLTDTQKARLATPHDYTGKPGHNWDIPTLAGAGAIRSTAHDMLRFIAANAGLIHSPLDKALAASHVVQFKDKSGVEMALGWHLQRGRVWHNGQTGGYHSYCGFEPEKKCGIVVLSNTAGLHVDALGDRLLKRLGGRQVEPLKLPVPVQVAAEDLELLVGKYQLAPFITATITRAGQTLYVQITGQDKIELAAESKTRFFCRAVEAQFDFEANDAGQIERLVIHQNGRDTPGKRLPDKDPPDEPAEK